MILPLSSLPDEERENKIKSQEEPARVKWPDAENMRRPIKYKKKKQNRLIAVMFIIAAVAVIAAAGIGISVAVQNRENPGPDNPEKQSDTKNGDSTADDIESQKEAQTTNESTEPVETDLQDASDSSTDTEDTTSPVDRPPSPITNVSSYENYQGAYLNLSKYLTINELRTAAKGLSDEGYTAVMIDLKYDNGRLSYVSSVQSAADYGANPTVASLNISDVIEALHGEGLYITGRLCAFRDDVAAQADMDIALMNESGYRYSDGTSRWISVYSEKGCQYILELIREVYAHGIDEIMLRQFGLPDSSDEKIQTEENQTAYEAVTAFIKKIRTSMPDLQLNLELPAAAVASLKSDTTGIDIEVLKAQCDSITADFTISNLKNGDSILGVTVTDPTSNPDKTVKELSEAFLSLADDYSIRPLVEWSGEEKSDTALKEALEQIGYENYQMIDPTADIVEK